MRLEIGKKYEVDVILENFIGWTVGDGSGHEGYSADSYFRKDGSYLGPDQNGIEPIFADEE